MSNYQHERGWLDSDVWGDAPYSEREAWSWMIGEANWADCIKNINGRPVEIKRGQFTASIRFMAKKFKWSTGKVQRFLKKLLVWEMIKKCEKTDTANDTAQTVITICNYLKYQEKRGKSDTQIDTEADTGAIQGRIQTINQSNQSSQFKKEKNTKKEKKSELQKPENIRDQVWRDFKTLRKEKKAPITQTALDGIEREAAKAGISLDQALSTCCANGWQGFKADWYNKMKGKENGRRESRMETIDRQTRELYSENGYDNGMGNTVFEALPKL